MDSVARAHAILGLRPGCSSSELKRAYRALVKRWHPDRYAADPAGQAEATRQLRAINEAVRLVAGHLSGRTSADRSRRVETVTRPGSGGPPVAATARPLSRAELDALVRAVGIENPVDIGLSVIADIGLFAVAVLCFVPQKGEPGVPLRDTITGVLCLAAGIIRVGWRRLQRWRSGRPANGSG